MNTRLQVEHPITEWTTGIDLVAEMVRIAAGEPLGREQDDVKRQGASVECRIYAEDPTSGFLPSPGTIERLRAPSGPWVRDDGGYYPGAAVPSYYDPLLSKLTTWGPNRSAAIARMRRALAEYVVTGIRTNIVFHQKLLEHPEFGVGNYDTGFIDRNADALLGYSVVPERDRPALAAAIAIAAAGAERRAAHQEGEEAEAAARPSPWVAQHRARSLR
jgi:acetyl-CoA carboxylase biotin carboxylase subunit